MMSICSMIPSCSKVACLAIILTALHQGHAAESSAANRRTGRPSTKKPPEKKHPPHAAPERPQFPDTDGAAGWEIIKAGTHGFETRIHAGMLTDLADHACTRILVDAQWGQDMTWNALDPTVHFDNCTFQKSQAYLAARYAEALAKAKQYRDQGNTPSGLLNDCLRSLGQGLHGLQDFYSHSNYLEIMLVRGATFEEANRLDLWKPEAKAELRRLQKEEGLTSGTVWWEPLPNDCRKGALSHSDLNKDSNESREGKDDGMGKETGSGKKGGMAPDSWQIPASWPPVLQKHNLHQLSLELAQQATGRYLCAALREIPELAAHCHFKLGTVVPFDKRRQ
jgi:hypothetical protein